MMPTHLLRMLSKIVQGDYSDEALRSEIIGKMIPELRQYRREVLLGIFKGRHQRPAGFITSRLDAVSLIRRALGHAHRSLMSNGAPNRVASLSAARSRRAEADQRKIA